MTKKSPPWNELHGETDAAGTLMNPTADRRGIFELCSFDSVYLGVAAVIFFAVHSFVGAQLDIVVLVSYKPASGVGYLTVGRGGIRLEAGFGVGGNQELVSCDSGITWTSFGIFSGIGIKSRD